MRDTQISPGTRSFPATTHTQLTSPTTPTSFSDGESSDGRAVRAKSAFGHLVDTAPSRKFQHETQKAPLMRGFSMVGAPGFEPGTSSPPDWRANQAAPRPVDL
jgi:hypothetical protein